MKITHSAVQLLLNDLQREQADEREILRAILDKLPDEHACARSSWSSRPQRRGGLAPAAARFVRSHEPRITIVIQPEPS